MAVLKQVMKTAKKKEPANSESNLQVFGVTTEVDQELQLFLFSRKEEEALEVSRGTEREPRLEQWRRRTSLYDILEASWTKSGRQQANRISAQKQNKIEKKPSRTPSKPGKTLNQDSWNALETNQDTCYSHLYVSHISRDLTAPQYLFPDCAQMRAQIVTVINSRARGPAPMMMGKLNEEAGNHDARSDEFTEGEVAELYRLETRDGKRVSSPSPGVIWGSYIPTGGGRGQNDKEYVRCGRFGHIRANCRANTHINGGTPKSAPSGTRRWNM